MPSRCSPLCKHNWLTALECSPPKSDFPSRPCEPLAVGSRASRASDTCRGPTLTLPPLSNEAFGSDPASLAGPVRHPRTGAASRTCPETFPCSPLRAQGSRQGGAPSLPVCPESDRATPPAPWVFLLSTECSFALLTSRGPWDSVQTSWNKDLASRHKSQVLIFFEETLLCSYVEFVLHSAGCQRPTVLESCRVRITGDQGLLTGRSQPDCRLPSSVCNSGLGFPLCFVCLLPSLTHDAFAKGTGQRL